MGWFSGKVEQFRQDWAAAGEALDQRDKREAKQRKAQPSDECSQNGCTKSVWQAGVCRDHGTAIFG